MDPIIETTLDVDTDDYVEGLTAHCPVHGQRDITAMGAESVTLTCGYVVL